MKPTYHPEAASPSRLARQWPAILFASGIILSSAQATAAGFGEIVLHSRVGENLLAEVPVIGNGKELADPDCYTLATQANADLPMITKARIRVVRHKEGIHLVIVGSRPIADPAFMLSLRANCGHDIRRDFVLMPDAPIQTAEAAASTSAPAPRVSESDLVEPAPAPPRKSKRTKNERRAAPPPSLGLSQDEARPIRETAAARSDRLVLSSAPLDTSAASGILAAPATAAEIEDRLLRMETQLRSLHEQVETLDTSLKLSTEMLSAQRDLQMAQGPQQPAGSLGTAPAATERENSGRGWFELALSSLLGGSVVVGLAAYFGRYRRADHPLV